MNYIAHHGVKGQKWGVRRYQNEDGTLTDLGKKRVRRTTMVADTGQGGITGGLAGYYVGFGAAIATGSITALPVAAVAGAAVGAGAAYVKSKQKVNQRLDAEFEASLPTRKLSEKEKKELGITDYVNKGGVLKKGSELYRVGTTDSSGKEVLGDRTYFSTNAYDNKKWESEFVPQLQNRSPKAFKYVTTKDLKIASATKLGEEYLKLQKEYAKSDILSTRLKDEAAYVNDMWGLRGDKSKFAGSKKGEAAVTASGLVASKRTKAGKELVDRLMKQGYHGVGDINGIDVANDPVILFNAGHSTKENGSKAFSRSEISKIVNSAASRTKDVRATVAETKSNRDLLKASVKSASKNSMLTNKEIAKRFGITEDELKSLLYG